MNFSEEALRMLADRMRWDDSVSLTQRREQLEASLVPVLRRALRNGQGPHPLMQWVQRNLPEPTAFGSRMPPRNLERAVPSMARQLCSQLLGQYEVQALTARVARETIVE